MSENTNKPQSKAPIVVLGVLLLASLGLLIGMWWQVNSLESNLEQLSIEHHDQLTLVGELLHLDGTVTTSARMAVHTLDPKWRTEYETTLPLLTNLLNESALRLGDTPFNDILQAMLVTNGRLAAMERKALRFSEIGEQDKAVEILESITYTKEHRKYHDQLGELSTLSENLTSKEFVSAQADSRRAWQMIIAAIPLLLIASALLTSILIRYIRTIQTMERVQESTRNELSILVDKAVAELTQSKQKLETEMETRIEAESELSAREKRYRSLVEMSQAGFVIIDEDGRLVDASDRYVELTGRKKLSDIKGQSIIEWTAGYHREKNAKALQGLYQDGYIQNLEIDYVDEDGHPRPVEVHGTRVVDGGKTLIYGLCLDISKRREAEQAVRDNEERYHRLIETTDTAFAVMDKNGMILDANQKYIDLTGHRELKEIIGRNALEWTVDFDKDASVEALAQCLRQGWMRDLQVDYSMKDGSLIPVEINASLMDGSNGKEIHMLCRDITERRIKEQALKDKEGRLSMAFKGGRIGFWDWNIVRGEVIYNEQWADLLGFTLDEIQTTYAFWESRVHPADREATFQHIEAHLEGKADYFEVEHRLQKKDGTWGWMLGVGRITERTSSGEPLRLTGVMIDITTRKEAEAALALSERRLRNVTQTSSDWIWQVDAQGRYTYAAESVTRILGYTPEELIGKTPFDLMPEDEADRVRGIFLDSVSNQNLIVDLENWNLTKYGERVCMLTNGVPTYDEEGEFAGYFGTDKDITDRKKSEYQLKLFGKVFESALEGITITDADGKIIAVNEAFTEITGYDSEHVIGLNPRVLKSDRHPDSFYTEMWESITQKGKWEGEIWNRRKSGDSYPEWLSISAIRDEDGHTSHYVAVFHDITETKRKEEQIEYQAYHDALTGLPNRLLLLDRLSNTIRRAKRTDAMAGVLFIDLDHFKVVNDSLGHATGDQLLLNVADRFKDVVRDSDTVARLGGDEFVVLMDEVVREEDAVNLAERIIESLEEPITINSRQLFTTPSIGIATYPRDGEKAESLIKNADIAMYRAKEQGRNRYNLFTESMNIQVQRRLELERDMRRGLVENEFFLCYQPKVDAATEKIVGMEALVRWDRKGELVSPMEFIPLAEKAGLISQLGEVVIDMALTECAEMLKCDDCLHMAVNLSPRQFQQPDLISMLESKLNTHGVDAQCLDLELTESSLLTDVEDTILKLNCLRQMGLTISVDDFGTGYSSLSYIKRLPVQTLKIDRSFVIGLGNDEGDEAIIKTVLQLARNFDMRVVAEGVETREQLDILKDFGCDQIQGYYYSKPLPIDEFKTFLAKING